MIKLQSDQFTYGMWETFFNFFFPKNRGWLPRVIIGSTSLKAYTIRFYGSRKIFMKDGGGADNHSERLCHLQALNLC